MFTCSAYTQENFIFNVGMMLFKKKKSTTKKTQEIMKLIFTDEGTEAQKCHSDLWKDRSNLEEGAADKRQFTKIL